MVIVFATVSVEVPVDVVVVVGVPVLVALPVFVGVPVLVALPVFVEVCVAVVATLPVAGAVAVAVAVTVRVIAPTGVGSGVAASTGLATLTPPSSAQAGQRRPKPPTTAINRALFVVVFFTVVTSGLRINASGVPARLVQIRVVTKVKRASYAASPQKHGTGVAVSSRLARHGQR